MGSIVEFSTSHPASEPDCLLLYILSLSLELTIAELFFSTHETDSYFFPFAHMLLLDLSCCTVFCVDYQEEWRGQVDSY